MAICEKRDLLRLIASLYLRKGYFPDGTAKYRQSAGSFLWMCEYTVI